MYTCRQEYMVHLYIGTLIPSFHWFIHPCSHPSIDLQLLLRPWRLGGTCPRACQVQWCGVHPGDIKWEDSEGWNLGAISPQKIVTSVCHDTKTTRNGGKLSSGTHIETQIVRVFQSRWQVKSGESQKGAKGWQHQHGHAAISNYNVCPPPNSRIW